MSDTNSWGPLAKVYDPIQCGNIDGTGRDVHDGGIHRALNSTYRPNKGVTGDCRCTIFVGQLNPKTSDETLRKVFSQFGNIAKVRVVKDLVTGYSKRYAFIEFSSTEEANRAHARAHGMTIDSVSILVEYEFERSMPGWIPRRLGGGFGGKKESGQLRFGCRFRPFKKPYTHSYHDRQQHTLSSRFHDSTHKLDRENIKCYKSERKYDYEEHSRNRGYRK